MASRLEVSYSARLTALPEDLVPELLVKLELEDWRVALTCQAWRSVWLGVTRRVLRADLVQPAFECTEPFYVRIELG